MYVGIAEMMLKVIGSEVMCVWR